MASLTSTMRHFKSLQELLDARRSIRPGDQLQATDCLCVAPFPDSEHQLWISSPNMGFVPEVPMNPDGKPFRYFSDGMLGMFEPLKWPQALYHAEPHAMAASGNPDLLTLDITASLGPKPASLPLESYHSLPTFSDYLAPWFSIDGKDFVPSQELPFGQFGSLSDAVLSRLQEALIEARSMSEDLGIKLVSSATTPEEELAGARDYKYQRGRADCLFVAYQRLSSVPMTSFDALLWFREFQRVLLDMRAWVIYKQEIQSRLFDPDFDSPTPVLPLRGVITKHFSVVNRLFRCGIPVWWIRERETLTTDTLIVRVKEVTRSSFAFTSDLTMVHGEYRSAAPLWEQAPQHDIFSQKNIHAQLRGFSLTSRPIFLPFHEYTADKIGNRRGEAPSSKAPGSSALAAVNHTEQVYYTLKQIIAVSTELYGEFVTSDSTCDRLLITRRAHQGLISLTLIATLF